MTPPPKASSGPRAASRLAAVQGLYQMELAGTDAGQVIEHLIERAIVEENSIDPRLLERLVYGVVKRQKKLDPALDALLDPGWPLTRLDATMRAILRAGAYEIMFDAGTHARVIMAEYVKIAEAFFDGGEPAMVNGVLNRLARERRPKEFKD